MPLKKTKNSVKPSDKPDAAPAVADACPVPARWLSVLSSDQQAQVIWMAPDKLKQHPACNFLPYFERSYATVRESVRRSGILFPLAIAVDGGGVLDGRYRLRAAVENGIAQVPVLAIDVGGEDAIRWAYEMKEDREHLSEAERAVLAVQYQHRLKGTYVKLRAKKAVAARNGELPVSDTEKADKPKLDSRRDACEKHQVPVREFNKFKNLAKDRPDLYKQVIQGELAPADAIKRKGKNVSRARVEAAKLQPLPPEPGNVDQDQNACKFTLENRIHCGDAVEMMRRVPDAIASLTLFSPPYHGVPIEYDPPLPKQTYLEYLEYHRQLLTECVRATRDGGRLAIVLDTVRNSEPGLRHHMLPVVADMTRVAIDCGWLFLNDLAWCKDEISGTKTSFGSFALCSAPGFGRNHETILLFCKGGTKLEGDHTLCDLSREEHLAWWTTAWHVKPEVNKLLRERHPAPFPEEIPHRLIRMLTYRRDLVIDPYNGSGTTTAVAKRLGRRSIGIDQSSTYCNQARERAATSTPERGLPESVHVVAATQSVQPPAITDAGAVLEPAIRAA